MSYENVIAYLLEHGWIVADENPAVISFINRADVLEHGTSITIPIPKPMLSNESGWANALAMLESIKASNDNARKNL